MQIISQHTRKKTRLESRVNSGDIVEAQCLSAVLAKPYRVCAMQVAWGAEAYAPPPMYNISAVSLRDAGLQQGRLAKERIRGWLGTTEMTELAEYAIKGEGRAAFQQLKADNTRFAPLLVGELEGVAGGAEVRTSCSLTRHHTSRPHAHTPTRPHAHTPTQRHRDPDPDPDPDLHRDRRRRRRPRCLST